jgi:hypothetical protein
VINRIIRSNTLKIEDLTVQEGPVGDFVQATKAAVGGAKKAFTQTRAKQRSDLGKQVPKGTNVVGMDNKTYVWHGAQWIGQDGKVARKDIAPQLTQAAIRQADSGIMKGIGMVAKGLGKGVGKIAKGVKSAAGATAQAYQGTVTGMKRGQDAYKQSMIGRWQDKVAPTPSDGLPGAIHSQLTGGDKVRKWEQEIAKHRQAVQAKKLATKQVS